MEDGRPDRICVVGAGITGLALAHHLDREGLEHDVLEAADEPGGVVRSMEVDGRVLDLGPQRTRLVPEVRTLVEELGLEGRLVEAPPGLDVYVYHDGGLHVAPLSLRDAVTTDLLSLRGKLRVLVEPLTGGAKEDETVADYLRRKFGREAYERYFGPLYAGLYGSDPEEMYVRHSLQRALREHGLGGSVLLGVARRAWRADVPVACSFERGMAELPRALHERHEERVELDTPVTAVESAHGEEGDGGYLVHTREGSRSYDAVVLTVPAAEASKLLDDVDPGASRRLESLNYNPFAVVHLLSDADVDGMGYKTALDAGLRTRGVTFNRSAFGRDGVYTAYLGGADDPGAVQLSDDDLGALAAREFEEVLGSEAEAVHVHRVEMPAYDRSWTAIDGLRTPPGIHLCANYESRAGLPGRLREARALAERLASGRPSEGSSDGRGGTTTVDTRDDSGVEAGDGDGTDALKKI